MSAERCTYTYNPTYINRGTKKAINVSQKNINIILWGAKGLVKLWKSLSVYKPFASDGNYCNIYSSYKFHSYSD